MNPVDRTIVNILTSHRTTRVLLALLIGINAAHLFRTESTHLRIITVGIILLASTAFILVTLQEERARNPRENPPLDRQDRHRRRYTFENLMLGVLFLASLIGALG